jgi:hypothetical protein
MTTLSSLTRPVLAGAAALLLAIAPAGAQQRPETAVPVGDAPAAGPNRNTTLRGTGPNGATLRCRDGSYPAPLAPESACDGKGGVLLRFPVRATPQAVQAPARPTVQAQARVVAPDTARPAGFTPWRERRAAVAAENAAQRPPEGATLRCGDGSWVLRDTTSARCAARGGVALRLPAEIRRRGN